MNGIEREKIGPLTLRLCALLTALAVWALYLPRGLRSRDEVVFDLFAVRPDPVSVGRSAV